MKAIETLIEELRRIPNIGTAADDLAGLIAEQQDQDFLTALTWIAARPRPVSQKLAAVLKLMSLPSPIMVSMRELTGWK